MVAKFFKQVMKKCVNDCPEVTLDGVQKRDRVLKHFKKKGIEVYYE